MKIEKSKMTPWVFEKSSVYYHPARRGIYEVAPFDELALPVTGSIRYAYWSGERWSLFNDYVFQCLHSYESEILRGVGYDRLTWRGFKEEQKA
jgi:hypothetical protein